VYRRLAYRDGENLWRGVGSHARNFDRKLWRRDRGRRRCRRGGRGRAGSRSWGAGCSGFAGRAPQNGRRGPGARCRSRPPWCSGMAAGGQQKESRADG
jgi:hypothetical protein